MARWDDITRRELSIARKRIADRGDIPLDKAAQAALIEAGHVYFIAAILKGLIRSADPRGRYNTRAMRSFEVALKQAGHLAEPVKKLMVELGVDTAEELKVMVTAYKHAQRHTPEDRVEAACRIIEDKLKTDHEFREVFARRFGLVVEGAGDAQAVDAPVARTPAARAAGSGILDDVGRSPRKRPQA